MSYSPVFFSPNATGSSMANSSGYQNGTASTMPIGTSVSVNNSSQMVLTDVTSESSAEGWLGLVSESTPTTATGQVYANGRLQNIPLSLGFSVGDPIWVGTSPGSLTNVKPSIGTGSWASGDFVLFVGVVVQNQFNPSNQDVQIFKQIVGQL